MSPSLHYCLNACGNVIPVTSFCCDSCLHGLTYPNIPQGQFMPNDTALQNTTFTGLYDGDATLNAFSVPSHPAIFRSPALNHNFNNNEILPPQSPWPPQSSADMAHDHANSWIPLAGLSTPVNFRQLNSLPSGNRGLVDAAIQPPSRPLDPVRAGTQQSGTRGNQYPCMAPTVDQNFRHYVPESNRDQPTAVRDATAVSCIRVFRNRGKSTPTDNPLACGTCANAKTTCIHHSLNIAPPFDHDCWNKVLTKIRSSLGLEFENGHGIPSYAVDVAINGAVTNNSITLETIHLDLVVLHQSQGLRTLFPNINKLLDTIISPSASATNCHVQALCHRFMACVNLVMRPDLSTICIQLKHGQAAGIIAIELLRGLAQGCSSLWKEIDAELDRILTSPRTKDPLIRWLNEAAHGLGMVSTVLRGLTTGADAPGILGRLLAPAKAQFRLFRSQLQRYRDIGPTEFDRGARSTVPNLPGIHLILRHTTQSPSDDGNKHLRIRQQIQSFQSILSSDMASLLTEPMEVDTGDIEIMVEATTLKIHEQEALISRTRSILESQEAELARLLAESSLARKESSAVLPKVQVEDISNLHSIPMDELSSSTSATQEADLRHVLSKGPMAQHSSSTDHTGLNAEHVLRCQTIPETVSTFPSCAATLVGTRGSNSSEGSLRENLAAPAVKKRKRDSILYRLSLASHRSSQMVAGPQGDLGVEQDLSGKRISRRWSKIVAKLEGPPISINRPVNNSRWSHPNRETKVDVRSLVAAINKRLSIGSNLTARMSK